MWKLACASLAVALLGGCHSEGTILLELSQDGAPTANVKSLEANADSVFFIQVHGKGDLMKLPKDGGTPRRIAPNVDQYVITGDTIVFVGDGSALFETTVEGGPPKQLLAGGIIRTWLAATSEKLYWIEWEDIEGMAAILSMPRDGSHAPEVLAPHERKPRYLHVDAAGDVFWTTMPWHEGDLRGSSQVRMLPAGGGQATTVVESPQWDHEIEIIAFDDTFLYTDAEPMELHRIPRAGGKSEVIAPLEGRMQLTVFEGTLYGYQSPEGSILSVPATGGDWSEIAVGHPESLAVDDTYVYWANAIFTSGGGEDDVGSRREYPASIARAER
jgi:hypothetical protein